MDGSFKRNQAPHELIETLGRRDAECEQHGRYVSEGRRIFGRREFWSSCPECIREAEAIEMTRQAQERAGARQRRLEQLLQREAIPLRFQDRTFDTYAVQVDGQRQALQTLREYASEFAEHRQYGRGLILVGGTGTGKTHLACSVLRSVLMQGQTGLHTSLMHLVRMVRDTWREKGTSAELEIFRAIAGLDLLVLDEIGVQYGTGSEQLIVGDLLMRRYELRAPTIMIGNEDMRGVRAYLGDRVFDRLRESAKAVVFDWDSYRKTLSEWA